MKRTRRFFVVIALVAAVNAAPTAALANPDSTVCQNVNDELERYGWQGNICILENPPPEEDPGE